MSDNAELKVLENEVSHIRAKVDSIDEKLEEMSLSSRLAVLEGNQRIIFACIGGAFSLILAVIGWICV